MITGDLTYLSSPVRSIKAKVELYEGSTLANTFTHDGALKSVTIERIGEENKFFGFGVCQKINFKLRDVERVLDITTANSAKVYFAAGAGEFVNPFTDFYVTEGHRDENTNQYSITAYDKIYSMRANTVGQLGLSSYTMLDFASECARFYGLTLTLEGIPQERTTYFYAEGANFDGSESIRDALDDVAEALQAVYFVRGKNLVFKRLDRDGAPVLTIDREQYITLDSKTNKRLSTIYHATDLGDDVFASTTESGSTQYVRNNAFWDLREDIASLVDAALATIGGLTLNQFECDWRGNYLLEIGDKIGLVTKDNETVISYVLDDVIEYNGALKQKTRWDYEENEAETSENPTSLGEAVKQTYARVDKINKEIQLVASNVEANNEKIASIQVNTDSIASTVTKIEQLTEETIEGFTEEIGTLKQQVEAAVTEEEVRFIIQSELNDGVDKVTTSTGFTFNEDGLTVSKSDSEMSTTVTEDGMTVYKNDEAMLIANNEGVKATNLHATTYLIIGRYTRFEDYNRDGEPRTGAFWIGEQ